MKKDIQSLTLGEIDEFETLTGSGLATMSDTTAPGAGKKLAALVYIFTKRENPDYTIADAFKLSIDEANAFLGVEEAEPDGDSEEGKD
ncbi:hypothetical protein [Microbacterium paludicola]|uniref:hypothetical protein n=1 Tax=Microbacterium paludicola TaxID=300019 RepID=UPI0009041512|nr:hypothetical protein [Microbacterium paludicola]APF33386.1 hypothetical protein BO218_03540 [Microbacterium paludicola]